MRRKLLGVGCVLLLTLASCGSNDGERLSANSNTNSATAMPDAAAESEKAQRGAMSPDQKSALARGADGEKRDFLTRQHADFADSGAKISLMRAFPSSLSRKQAKQVAAPSNIQPVHPPLYWHPAVLAKRTGREKAQLDQQSDVVARQLPQRADLAIQLPARKYDATSHGQ
ncbi:MAG TPA: hypothetical protein VIF60_11425 [Burkholderiaceae bacterium]